VRYSRTGFPDLAFTIHDLIATEHRVCVRWSAEGTHAGDLVGLPATGKRLRFTGLTIYDIAGEQVGGHWQVVDRLGFMQQLRAGRA
jgi:predicted ester cyclase